MSRRRFGDRLGPVEQGVRRDGAYDLFTLRLVPNFPFFLVDPLMGPTPIATRPYAAVSQLGMLAGTMVYVNAGTDLARIESLRGRLSPTLIGAFVLLGVFPLLSRTARGGSCATRAASAATRGRTTSRSRRS